MDLNKLHALAELADQLENQGFIVEANNVHNLFKNKIKKSRAIGIF